jgi:protein-S-isoprenylcysteine O-methyltransferase Ste14
MDSALALFLLLPCLAIVDQFVIQREERYLAAQFGADYQAYCQKVRRWL